jgi:serine/threonine-protein kinase
LWVYKHKTYIGAPPVAIGPMLVLSDRKGKIAFVDPNSGELRDVASAKYSLEHAPVWDSDRFFVTTSYPRKRVYALQFKNGDRAWRRDFRQTPEPPIIVKGELWVAAGDTLYALDPAHGEILRKFCVGDRRWLKPVMSGSSVILLSENGTLRSVDLSGRTEWEIELGMICGAPPLWTNAMAVVSTTSGVVAAVNAGAVAWTDTLDAEALYTPASVGDVVFVAGLSGNVWAVDLSTGEVRWKQNLGAPAAAEPLVRDGWVAVNSVDGKLWFLDQTTGAIQDSVVFSALIHEPAVWAFGRLYIVTDDKKLHAFGAGP